MDTCYSEISSMCESISNRWETHVYSASPSRISFRINNYISAEGTTKLIHYDSEESTANAFISARRGSLNSFQRLLQFFRQRQQSSIAKFSTIRSRSKWFVSTR
mmetsp:Transcript_2294/g.3103  ORF Transcript_2294/g.3103 Transcript_2294/m.3103 type:complete len:104 (+) Transcript_2294:2-313(+)